MQNNKNVTYEEYVELIAKKVAERTRLEVKLNKVLKNNGLVLDGLTILSGESNLVPNIYLNNLYNEFLEYGMNTVVEKIIYIHKKNKMPKDFDISNFTDREKVCPLIRMKLINYERNIELLKNVPHQRILDLAIVFMVVLKNEPDMIGASIPIYNKHLEYWGMTADDLYEIAKENIKNDVEIMSMGYTMKLFQEDKSPKEAVFQGDFMAETGFYILTNHAKFHGAVGMLNTEYLSLFMKSKRIKKLIIIPSSIHEVILLFWNPSDEVEDLRDMLNEVNTTQRAPEEILSDNVYVYDNKELSILEPKKIKRRRRYNL